MNLTEKLDLFNLVTNDEASNYTIICASQLMSGYTYVFSDYTQQEQFAEFFYKTEDISLDQKIDQLDELLHESPEQLLLAFLIDDSDGATFSDFELSLWKCFNGHSECVERLSVKEKTPDVVEEPLVLVEPEGTPQGAPDVSTEPEGAPQGAPDVSTEPEGAPQVIVEPEVAQAQALEVEPVTESLEVDANLLAFVDLVTAFPDKNKQRMLFALIKLAMGKPEYLTKVVTTFTDAIVKTSMFETVEEHTSFVEELLVTYIYLFGGKKHE